MTIPLGKVDFDVFMKWAREAFGDMYGGLDKTPLRPIDKPFPDDYHFIGDDHEFTENANKAIPKFSDRLKKHGIVLPTGELAIVSHVRKSVAYQEKPDEEGVWTFDWIRHLPKDHPIVVDVLSESKGDGSIHDVRQWFAINRFQASAYACPPVLPMLYGFIDWDEEKRMMGGCFAINKLLSIVLGMSKNTPEEHIREINLSLAYECCETLRQAAAILYLK